MKLHELKGGLTWKSLLDIVIFLRINTDFSVEVQDVIPTRDSSTWCFDVCIISYVNVQLCPLFTTYMFEIL
jgi:hypothetical protein